MKKKHEYVTGILTEAKIEPLENFNFMNYLHFFPAKIKKFSNNYSFFYFFWKIFEILKKYSKR